MRLVAFALALIVAVGLTYFGYLVLSVFARRPQRENGGHGRFAACRDADVAFGLHGRRLRQLLQTRLDIDVVDFFDEEAPSLNQVPAFAGREPFKRVGVVQPKPLPIAGTARCSQTR